MLQNGWGHGILSSEPVQFNKRGNIVSMAFAFINKIKTFWSDQDNYLTKEAQEALDTMCQDFFDHLLNRRAPEAIAVQSLQAYCHKGMCFFHVRFTQGSVTADQAGKMDVVYYGSDRIENYINLDWTWWEGREKYRDMYREAVSKGGQKVYSQEEIARYIQNYFSKKNQTTV